MCHNIEAELIKQHLVFRWIEAGMVEWFSPILTNRLAVPWTRIEHYESGRGCVGGEHVEHFSLIIGLKEEKAVPTENAVKSSVKRDCPHVRHNPLLLRHAPATERDERRGGIDTSDTKSMLHEIVSDRHS